jgi:protein-arginine kinase activator protein McsA
MADYTYDQLKKLTVVKLREIAQGLQNDALQGCLTMHKEQLLPVLCKVLGIGAHHAIHAAEKVRMKATIRKMKAGRDKAVAAHDGAKAAIARSQIHALKRRLRQMEVRGA